MTTVTTKYPLRLPVSIKREAEKVALLRTTAYFTERRDRADWDTFDRLMARQGGQPPREGDEMAEIAGGA